LLDHKRVVGVGAPLLVKRRNTKTVAIGNGR
jgi:hypothetical protein